VSAEQDAIEWAKYELSKLSRLRRQKLQEDLRLENLWPIDEPKAEALLKKRTINEIVFELNTTQDFERANDLIDELVGAFNELRKTEPALRGLQQEA
jgi:hypothetical protein